MTKTAPAILTKIPAEMCQFTRIPTNHERVNAKKKFVRQCVPERHVGRSRVAGAFNGPNTHVGIFVHFSERFKGPLNEGALIEVLLKTPSKITAIFY